jgi:hypothetical protein
MFFYKKACPFSDVPVGVRATGKIIYTFDWSRDSSVDTVTGYSLVGWNSVSVKKKCFFLLHRVQTGSGTNLSNGYWWFFRGDKAVET